jgi:hypothetical protein
MSSSWNNFRYLSVCDSLRGRVRAISSAEKAIDVVCTRSAVFNCLSPHHHVAQRQGGLKSVSGSETHALQSTVGRPWQLTLSLACTCEFLLFENIDMKFCSQHKPHQISIPGPLPFPCCFRKVLHAVMLAINQCRSD